MEELCPVTRKQYSINGVEVTFLPGDPDWIERFSNMAETIEEKIRVTHEEQAEVDADPKAMFALAKKRDKIIREEIDSVFGDGAANAVYRGNMTALSNGLPVWFEFVVTIAEKVEAVIEEQKKQGNERLGKYEAKFKKYRRKK